MDDLELLESYQQLSRRCHRSCYTAKILSAGGMLGTAVLFPIARADGLPFSTLTLPIFTLCSVVFLVLHLEPSIRFGAYTAPVALFILLLFVLTGSPSNKSDIIPWLPLYAVFFCLVTTSLHQFPYRITLHQSPAVAQLHWGSDSHHPSAAYRGHRTNRSSSEWSDTRPPSQSYRNDPSSFQHMGPGSSRSVQTGSGGTEYTLGNLDGARRDPHAAFIYGNAHAEAAEHNPGGSRPVTSDTYEAAAHMELGQVRTSQDSALESQAPLLGSYD